MNTTVFDLSTLLQPLSLSRHLIEKGFLTRVSMA